MRCVLIEKFREQVVEIWKEDVGKRNLWGNEVFTYHNDQAKKDDINEKVPRLRESSRLFLQATRICPYYETSASGCPVG